MYSDYYFVNSKIIAFNKEHLPFFMKRRDGCIYTIAGEKIYGSNYWWNKLPKRVPNHKLIDNERTIMFNEDMKGDL